MITITITITIIIIIIRPYIPLATSAQAALAPHQTTDQEESADTNFMAM
jgi:hypothetical protein